MPHSIENCLFLRSLLYSLKNIGLLNFSFYNDGAEYYSGLGCSNPGAPGCPKIYFMFSTECGSNPPPRITCGCLVNGCPIWQMPIGSFPMISL